MCKLLITCLLVGVLAACTPPYHPENRVEWHITNHTADTLLLTVRYRVDSVVVSPSDVPRMRQTQTDDSLGLTHGLYPLYHLARHGGRWYLVSNAHVTAFPFWSDVAGKLHAAATNRMAGIITYKLVPGGGHHLTTHFCLPCDTLPPALPPLVSLRLQQGRARRVLPLGPELNQLFEAQFYPWRQWLHWGPITYRFELRVGPGLTLNDE